MGFGSYTSADWSKLKKSRKITESSDAGNIFEKKEFRMYDGGYYFEAVCTNTTLFENEFD